MYIRKVLDFMLYGEGYKVVYEVRNLKWIATSILLILCSVSQVMASSEVVEIDFGEVYEECDTEQTLANAIVLGPSDPWQNRIKFARPGDTFLLRGGVYHVKKDGLRPAEGRSERYVTVKPYDCEEVMIWGGVRPQSYNIFAGLRIETETEAYAVWVSGREAVRHIELRNNSILGGTKKALLINHDARHIRVVGNIISGAKSGHSVWIGNWDTDKSAKKPEDVLLDRNLLKKDYFGDIRSSEDTLAIKTVGSDIVLSNNIFTTSYNIENVIDIKGMADGPITIRDNTFDGPNLFLGSYGGNDSTGVCIVIGNEEKPAELMQHVIEGNFFNQCEGGGVALGSGKRNGSASIRYNVFYQTHTRTIDDQAIFGRSFNTEIVNNTYIKGAFKLGRYRASCGASTPQGLVVKNNIFYETRVIDQTDHCPTVDYQVKYNLLYDLPETFERGERRHNFFDAPEFVNRAAGDFRLTETSPARAAGEGGIDLGAYPVDTY